MKRNDAKKLAKNKRMALAISAFGVLLLYSALAWLTAPQTETFRWNSVNPLDFAEGMAFALSFGLGLPVWLAVLATTLLTFLLWMALWRIVRKLTG